MTIHAKVDVIIVGGGFIGPALANMLQGTFKGSVALVAPPTQQVQTTAGPLDTRATALSYSSHRILRSMGLWPSHEPSPIKRIHVSQQGSFGRTMMEADPYPALGYVIENDVLQTMLHATPTHHQDVAAVTRTADGIGVRFADGTELIGSLLVCADGSQSPTAKLAGFAYDTVDHRQAAIATNVRLAEPHNGLAIERFTDEGPVALLPLANQGPDVCSLVLCREMASASQWQQKNEADFLRDLSALFNRRVTAIDMGQRQRFPLQSHQASQLCLTNSVVIGNAAQALHPVAGQGFNLGLRDAAALAELLVADDYSAANYLALRQLDRQKIWRSTNLLASLFVPNQGPLPLARGVGLLGLDIAEKLRRREFKEHAMGLRGWQSKLARGLSL